MSCILSCANYELAFIDIIRKNSKAAYVSIFPSLLNNSDLFTNWYTKQGFGSRPIECSWNHDTMRNTHL
ncbi:hypothetical protein POVWA2_054650 [Plasmodium ovale wallikeri]|uniref:Uncharacterized protein n=1 Tax=Plasmodium ovale wallikeri TaxID=864142 RepID=A0A1A8ZUR0_PLAOA|nr:hypothetical protein POVWA1_056080 [Plasmodium ovale wallikeri]SBT47713.1 hypothetical protein POVWA2_054650 [Plasmodium ovale wallikeri]